MTSRFRTKGAVVAALIALAASVALSGAAVAGPQPGAPAKRGFRLFARALGAMTINRVYCGLASDGRVCVDSTNSSTIGGGFWPKGTPDQYVFNSGMWVAGIIGNDGGPWAGDTVGGFFFDPKGTTEHGEEVQPIYNAANSSDLAAWPDAACVPNGDAEADIFNPLLQTDAANAANPNCRKSASQGDVWWMSWEGNPALNAGRKHPLGIVVETRGMGWNFPAGNEDILYFIYTFYNVTSTDPAAYAAVRPAVRSVLLQKAADFQALNEAKFGVSIPDAGYTINSMYAAFAADMDVAEAGANYSSVNLPFALGWVYTADFQGTTAWRFDASIFGGAFFPGAGFVGVKYLKSPTGPGAIQLFSNTLNGVAAFNDPQNVVQQWRYTSGNISPAAGDGNCNTGNPLVTNICYINNVGPADMRFYQSSTGLTIAPGQFGSIVVGYIFAAPVKTGACPGPACTDVKPGDPTRLTNTAALVSGGANTVDTATGFLGFTDANTDGIAQQTEFSVVPGSLLGKSLVAQDVFNNKFLLPFAPDPPEFFLIPGNNQVTVLWKPSPSEVSGDPFFSIASQAEVIDPVSGLPVANNLYDPNYRQFDVEGYRVYRGRVDNPNELSLLAQFDYAGTEIDDYTGIVNPTTGCMPEAGINTDCPVAFSPNPKDGTPLTVFNPVPLAGPIVQVRAGAGRVALANGTALLTKSDTLTSGGGKAGSCLPSACPDLDDTGVPFVFVDRTPRNNFRYFYSVTAFDVNSIESGPTNLESQRRTKSTTPVAPATNYVNTADITVHVVGRGVAMDTIITADPTIDAVTGKFSGPSRPANGLLPAFVGEFVKSVVAQPGAFSVRLDSVTTGESDATDFAGLTDVGNPTIHYVTVKSGSDSTKLTLSINQGDLDDQQGTGSFFNAINVNGPLAQRYGGDGSFSLKGTAADSLPGINFVAGWGLGCRFPARSFQGAGSTDCEYNGPRWFDGPTAPTSSPLPSARELTETRSDPNGDNCAISGNSPACATPGLYNNAGALTGVTTVYFPQSYTQIIRRWRNFEYVLGSVFRAADINVYWGAGGTVDSVIDLTHNVVVPFGTGVGASWGILNGDNPGLAGSFDARADLSVADLGCVAPMNTIGGPGLIYPCGTTAALEQTARLTTTTLFQDNQANVLTSPVRPTPGFMLYVTGMPFIMEMTALPAAGTVWTVRSYAGAITGGNGAGGGNTGLPYRFTGVTRPMTAVGAEVQVAFNVVNQLAAPTGTDLKAVHTVPDPYYVTNDFEQTADTKILKFVNLPQRCIIRIYSSSGVLVAMLEHRSSTFGGEETWNVRNRNNQVVASGVYFYHIEANLAGSSARRVGRFTVVNFAQ